MKAEEENKLDQYIGNQVRCHRRAKGFSQQDLARSIGISFQQIQKYESASNRISVSRLIQIAKTLDISPIAFFPTQYQPSNAYHDHLDAISQELLTHYRAIHDDTLSHLIFALICRLGKK